MIYRNKSAQYDRDGHNDEHVRAMWYDVICHCGDGLLSNDDSGSILYKSAGWWQWFDDGDEGKEDGAKTRTHAVKMSVYTSDPEIQSIVGHKNLIILKEREAISHPKQMIYSWKLLRMKYFVNTFNIDKKE